MKSFLAYELAPQPPSLFHDGLMRKTNKNVLGLLLKSKVEPYVRHHFGSNTVVVFDGYERSNSTKAPEQQRRASKSVSRDLLFDEKMKTVSTQASFLVNAANKSRLIAMIITKFQHHGISTRQADANADSLIASTGLAVAKSEKNQL